MLVSIQTTKYITRQSAIDRIRKISRMIVEMRYLDIESCSLEYEEEADEVAHVKGVENIEQWTNGMLEDQMGLPFYRESIFDNYLIENEN